MRRFVPGLYPWGIVAYLAVILPCNSAEDRHTPPPTNFGGAPVRDAKGQRIMYDRAAIERMESPRRGVATRQSGNAWSNAKISWAPARSVKGATTTTAAPLWQYAMWGSSIGTGNILFCPTAAKGDPPEIILAGNSTNGFGGGDFWQVVRRNPSTGNFDQLFVSPIYNSNSIYPTEIARIALGNVVGDGTPEIVVLLQDGRIFIYDLATKSEVGYLETGVFGFKALSLADLNDDGYVDLIITTRDDLFVADGATGALLFWVPNAGGWDVTVGQMDDDTNLEIATTNGYVIDAGSRYVQWIRNGGFGYRVRVTPFGYHTRQYLIAAEAWDYIYAYDVGRQLPLWSMENFNTDAIEVANIQNDATSELLIGDAQWGTVHVHDLETQTKLWEIENPEHGVTSIAIGDVDGDGVAELLWGAGASSTGSDYLYVADCITHSIKWQSLDVNGPFVGPVIGDLDGDGQAELVFCAQASESYYDSGRIFIFDLATLTSRAISGPVADNSAVYGIRDLKLRDVDHDGRMEILIATDHGYDGLIEIYGFDSANNFTRKWSNPAPRVYGDFVFVDAADLDGNGTTEIVGAHAAGYIDIFDYGSQNAPWQSVHFSGSPTGLTVRDLDGNSSKEIAVLTSSGDLYTFDGASRQLLSLQQASGLTQFANQESGTGLVGSDSSGIAHFLRYTNNTYSQNFTRQLGYHELNGISISSDGRVWTGRDSVLTLRLPSEYDTQEWQSPIVSPYIGGSVAIDPRQDRQVIYAAGKHEVVALALGPNPSYALDAFAFNGTITPTPDQFAYAAGTRISLSATPNPGFQFTGWSGDIFSTSNPLTVTMDSNLKATANFAARRYRINVSTWSCTVTKTPDSWDYGYGDEVTLTAVPYDGYQFTGWAGDASGTTNPLVIKVDDDKDITAYANLPAATPTIKPNGGTFKKSVKVTLACATSGAAIHYTTDGTEPTATSRLYSSAFMIKGKGLHVLKARAFATGHPDSAVASANFKIK